MKHLAHKASILIKLYLCYIKLSIVKGSMYRVNFLLTLLIGLSNSAMLFLLYELIFEKFGYIGTWDKRHVMLLVATYMIVESLYLGIAFHNISRLPSIILHGQLDKYLVRPVSVWASLIFEEIDWGSILTSVIGSALILYYYFSHSTDPEIVVSYFSSIGLGVFCLYNFLFLLMSLAFWLGQVDELRDVLSWIVDLSSKPAFIFPSKVRAVLYWILPLFLTANVPVEFLTGERDWRYIGMFYLAALPLFLLSVTVWHIGLKRYSSANS